MAYPLATTVLFTITITILHIKESSDLPKYPKTPVNQSQINISNL